MEEQLILFETAKFAKEKGFYNGGISYFFKNNGDLTYKDQSEKFVSYDISAPTQGLLQKWLREKHNLYICISAEFYKTGINHTLQILCYNPNLTESDYYDNDKCTGMYGDNAEFETYEDALEFGLQKALTFVP